MGGGVGAEGQGRGTTSICCAVSCPCQQLPKPQVQRDERGSLEGLGAASAMGCFGRPREDVPLRGAFQLEGWSESWRTRPVGGEVSVHTQCGAAGCEMHTGLHQCSDLLDWIARHLYLIFNREIIPGLSLLNRLFAVVGT